MEPDPRRKILQTLRRDGPQTAPELASRLECTAAAIRVQLRRLESLHQVASTLERPRRGRPVARFRLTREADAEFPRSYDLFASRFVASVIQLYGPESLQRVLEQWEDGLHARLAGALPDAPTERLQALARHQTEHGFMASVRHDEDGIALVEHNCPILELAKTHPEFCARETALWSRVLKWKTTLASCQADGAGACVFRIGRRKNS